MVIATRISDMWSPQRVGRLWCTQRSMFAASRMIWWSFSHLSRQVSSRCRASWETQRLGAGSLKVITSSSQQFFELSILFLLEQFEFELLGEITGDGMDRTVNFPRLVRSNLSECVLTHTVTSMGSPESRQSRIYIPPPRRIAEICLRNPVVFPSLVSILSNSWVELNEFQVIHQFGYSLLHRKVNSIAAEAI